MAKMTTNRHRATRPITSVMTKDFYAFNEAETVSQAMDAVRAHGLGDRIAYFYVMDDEDRLTGVIPTKLLLTEPLDRPLSQIMIKNIVVIPENATAGDACALFADHKFLALPVVDGTERIVGVVDISMFTDEVLDIQNQERMNEIFETIGYRVSQVRDASIFRAFKFRFPWLLATIASGTICAALASVFEITISRSIALAFFLTLVLGLGESVSIQSMTVAIQAMHSTKPSLMWYMRSFRRETGSALLVGIACGAIVGLIVFLWLGVPLVAASIGMSILMILCLASFFGLSVPALLHTLGLDLKIAAGPITLALTDIATLLVYFSTATVLLRQA